MTHSELCELSCRHFLKDYHVGLWEYQSFSTSEFPDVLLLGAKPSMLLEIKTSRSDFLADKKKQARIKHVNGVSYTNIDYTIERIEDRIKNGEYVADKKTVYKLSNIKRFSHNITGHFEYVEKPHLGTLRYFVCEKEIIKPEDLPVGWGLIWVSGAMFYKKVDSKRFRPNMMAERDIIVHAMREHANGNNRNRIMVKPY